MAERETGVRGEYNRTFNVDAVGDPTQGVFVFVSPEVQQYMLLVKPGKKMVVNGEVITEPDVTAFFTDFNFRTDDAELASLIRKTPAFKAGRIQELGTLRDATKQKRIEDKAKEVAADPELAKAVLAALKQGRAVAPTVA